ncbi:MAG: SPOR domain-containing protein [Pseudomonadota bacterium]
MLSGEDFGYLKDEEQNRLAFIAKKALLLGSVLFSIACFVYITVNAYYFAYHDKDSNIKVIKSPPEPIKVVEEEGEGTAIKDIDKTIYDNIVGNKTRTQENLNNVKIIQQAHTPLAKAPAIKRSTAEIVVDSQPAVQTANQSAKADNSKIMVYDTNTSAKPVNDASLVAPKKVQPEQNQAEAKPAAKPAKGLSRVQVAALTSKAAAADYWSKLSKNYPQLFSSLNYFISEAHLGAKGTFYRLQIGNFRSQVEAEDFCRKFIFQAGKSKADCIIVE